jgi:hypothetical protein
MPLDQDLTRSRPPVWASGSLARPGGNVTGFTLVESSIVGKWLELLKEIAPRVNRVVFLFPRSRLEEVAQHTDDQEADCNHPTILFRFVGDRESNGWSFQKRHLLATLREVIKARSVWDDGSRYERVGLPEHEFRALALSWAPFFRTQVQVALALKDNTRWHLCYVLTVFSTSVPNVVPSLSIQTKSIRAFRTLTP